MKISTLLLLLMFGVSAHAEERFCPKVNVKSQGEGHWPIPEKAFTREEAQKHWKSIQEILDGTMKDDDPEVWQNAFMMVRGYILKREIRRSIEFKNDFMKKYATQEFCDFLETEAYVRH